MNDEREIKLGLWKRTREEEELADEMKERDKWKTEEKRWSVFGQKTNKKFRPGSGREFANTDVRKVYKVEHNFTLEFFKFNFPPNAAEREHLKNNTTDEPWAICTRNATIMTLGDPISVYFYPEVTEAYVRPPSFELIIRFRENYSTIIHPHFKLEVKLSHREHKNQHYLGIQQLSFFNSHETKTFLLHHKEIFPGQSINIHHSKVQNASIFFASILHDLWTDYKEVGFPNHFQIEFAMVALLNTARKQVVVEFNPPMCKDCMTLSLSVDPVTLTCPFCAFLFNK